MCVIVQEIIAVKVRHGDLNIQIDANITIFHFMIIGARMLIT